MDVCSEASHIGSTIAVEAIEGPFRKREFAMR